MSPFRLLVSVALFMMLMWTSRIPVLVFGFERFSYLVYACVGGSTLLLILMRLSKRGTITLAASPAAMAVWCLMAFMIIGGLRAAANADQIPAFLIVDQGYDFRAPWPLFRTIALPGIMMLALTLLLGAAYAKGTYPGRVLAIAALFIWTTALMVILFVLLSGMDLASLSSADQRSALSGLGFHANSFGAILALTYALLLGIRRGTSDAAQRLFSTLSILVTLVAILLTFSRAAYLAVVVATGLNFLRVRLPRKIVFVAIATALLFALPDAVWQRVGYGLDTGDANEISAGRVENLWVPLLDDVGQHPLLGQGLNAILWTDAQRARRIFPMSLSHNAYLDLMLDFGILGTVFILGAYLVLWRNFLTLSKLDPDPRLRGLFHGGHLAMVSFLLIALTNDRLTPTASAMPLWLAVGILLARARYIRTLLTPVIEGSIVRGHGAGRTGAALAPEPQGGT